MSTTLLAAILGMKKETLSRLLRSLADQRLIELSDSRHEIAVFDRARLASQAY